MGAEQSSRPTAIHLEDMEFERQYSDMWIRLSGGNESVLNEQTFVTNISTHTVVATKIFRYLSLGHAEMTKQFLHSRIRDLKSGAMHERLKPGLNTAPFWTVIESVNLIPSDIMQMIMGSVDHSVPTVESDSVEELREKFPSTDVVFNACILALLFGTNIHPLDMVHYAGSQIIPAGSIQSRVVNFVLPPSSERNPHLLFSTKLNGSSFKILGPAIKYYSGGILFLFERERGEGIFGLHTFRDKWEDTPLHLFDESARDTILFQVSPQMRIRRPNRVGGRNYLYMNTTNPNHPIGVGLGGREGSFRLWLDGSDISHVSCMESDATFEPGHLVSREGSGGKDFQINIPISSIELWGFGGEIALERQQRLKAEEAELKQDRRKIDKTKLLENQFNREMFFAKTFKGSQAEADRLGNA